MISRSGHDLIDEDNREGRAERERRAVGASVGLAGSRLGGQRGATGADL